jgi:hypothetical protein
MSGEPCFSRQPLGRQPRLSSNTEAPMLSDAVLDFYAELLIEEAQSDDPLIAADALRQIEEALLLAGRHPDQVEPEKEEGS